MRKPPISRYAANYNFEHTHYVVRVGNAGSPHAVDYIVPGEQNPELAEIYYQRLLEIVISGVAKEPTDDVIQITLVKRKSGSRRPSGRVRFYESVLAKVTVVMEPLSILAKNR